MKKLFSLALALCLLLCAAAPAAYAYEMPQEPRYPTVMVAGYSSSDLFLLTPEGEQKIWGVDTDEILQQVLTHIAEIGRGLGELAFQHPEFISDVIGRAVLEMYGDLAFNPDGTSVNPIVPYAQDLTTRAYDALLTQHKYLRDALDGMNIHEREISASLEALYGGNGDEWVFSFQTDFRRSIVDIAADLDRYIDSLLEETGAEKVNIFAVSHGGEIVSAYLHEYGVGKNAVNTVVMTVPSIGGAALAYDVMSETVRLDEETLLYFIENGNMMETDINWLVRANRLGILDEVCNLLIHNYIKKILGYWGSMWDFIPTEYYEALKTQYLNEEENAELIAKSDYFHEQILGTMTEALGQCVEAGMNLYIVAGCGIPSVTGLQEQSDAIITVSSSTGAETAPYGYRFADGYEQRRTVCTDASHDHLSPSMAIDVSAGYLPEYTWFVEGMYHGMTWKEPYAKELCLKLMASAERLDVHTDPAFPQFKYAENNSYSVLAAFDASPEGILTASDTALIVTNLSQKYPMRLLSIDCAGADLSFDLRRPVYIKPGERAVITMKGSLPEISLTTADLTVTYTLIGSVTPANERVLTFRIENGPAPAYDAAQPFAPAHAQSYTDGRLPETLRSALQKTNVYYVFKMLLNALHAYLEMFRAFTLNS